MATRRTVTISFEMLVRILSSYNEVTREAILKVLAEETGAGLANEVGDLMLARDNRHRDLSWESWRRRDPRFGPDDERFRAGSGTERRTRLAIPEPGRAANPR